MPDFVVSLASGAVAGTLVDSAFFPLDTLKTRLQSQQGFFAAGGFRGLYAGFSSAVMGSAPSAGAFFVTYDQSKKWLHYNTTLSAPLIHMSAASMGEVVACIIRVPVEVVKQRMQTNRYNQIHAAVKDIIQVHGFKGMYRGFLMTIMREIPFTCIQFPLYEHFKSIISRHQSSPVSSLQAAVCGSVAGGIAAAFTTPLDVLKTRAMLSDSKDMNATSLSKLWKMAAQLVKEEGVSRLFSGIGPRVLWISLGGFVFLGAYEQTRTILESRSAKSKAHSL